MNFEGVPTIENVVDDALTVTFYFGCGFVITDELFD
jgi:hypothetical protein